MKHRKSRALAWALTALAAAAVLAPGRGSAVLGATGATRFVSPGGSDTGDCTEAACATIQYAVNASSPGDTVQVDVGTYVEDVMVDKAITLQGAGLQASIVSGTIGGNPATVRVAAMGVVIDGFTITREGNNPADWNDPGPNTAGIAVFGQTSRAEIRNCLVLGNRVGIEIDDSNGNFIHNNIINVNRTGVVFRNQTDQSILVENFISSNWAIGVLFADGSAGTGTPAQTAASSIFSNNYIAHNWSAQIVDRQAGGALPPPGTVNMKNFAGNWLGRIDPAVASTDTAFELADSEIPVDFGGTAFPTGPEFDVGGPASSNLRLRPLLKNGDDQDIETTPGRGVAGFQGGFGEEVREPHIARQGENTAPTKDWVLYASSVTSAGEFRHGPGVPPLGTGSLELDTTGPADNITLLNFEHDTTRLAAITVMSYATYRISGSASQVPSLHLQVHPNGPHNGPLATLVYEPVHDHPGGVLDSTWQVWDAYKNGTALWWSTADLRDATNALVACNPNGPLAGELECAGKLYVPWSAIAAALPDAFIAGGLGVNQGAEALVAAVDQLRVGVVAYAITYDFEPRVTQEIQFAELPDMRLGDSPSQIDAIASSGLPVFFSAAGPCSLDDYDPDDFISPSVIALAPGICTITASQPGSAFVEPAPDVVRSFTIRKRLATLLLSNLLQIYDGTPRQATVTSAPAELAVVTVTYEGSSSAPIDVGYYDVVASLDNPDYEAFEVTGTLIVMDARESQAITAPLISAKSTLAVDFSYTAYATSGLEVTFAAAGPCSVSPTVNLANRWMTTIGITGAGTCTITMLQAGNAQWAPATATRSFVISKANQKITFPTIASRTQSAPPFDVTATSNSGLPITFTATGQCSLSNPTDTTVTVTLTGATGNCSITASQPGNGDYNPAASVTRTFSITPNVVLASVTVSPTSFAGTCAAVTGKVSLNVTTPTTRTIALVSSSPLVTVPATVDILPNQKTATFTIQTSDVSTNVQGTISATLDAVTVQGGFTLRAPRIFSIALNPGLVIGGTSTTAIVTLDCKAPAGGLSVPVTSSSVRASVVGSPLMIGEGASTGSVTVNTTAGPLATATIKATANGVTKSATLTIQP
jgi:parallel beta-helix repeat protein